MKRIDRKLWLWAKEWTGNVGTEIRKASEKWAAQIIIGFAVLLITVASI